MKPTGNNLHAGPGPRPIVQDTHTAIPAPFSLPAWLADHEAELAEGKALNLFEGHPDREITVIIVGGASQQDNKYLHETWLYQLKGEAQYSEDGAEEMRTLKEGDCYVVSANTPYLVERPAGSIGMVVTQDPWGNKVTAMGGQEFGERSGSFPRL